MRLWCRSMCVCLSNMRKFLCMKSFYREQKILLVFQIVHLVFLCSPNCSGYAFQCWFSWLCNLSGLLSHLPWMWFRSQSPLDLSCFAISLVFHCYPFIMVVYLVFWILNTLLLELIPQQLPNALLQLVFFFLVMNWQETIQGKIVTHTHRSMTGGMKIGIGLDVRTCSCSSPGSIWQTKKRQMNLGPG